MVWTAAAVWVHESLTARLVSALAWGGTGWMSSYILLQQVFRSSVGWVFGSLLLAKPCPGKISFTSSINVWT